MVARERVDPGQASDGLHNLLTGLTLQSPAPSPSSLHAHATANLTSSLSAPSAPSLEQTLFNTPSRSIFSSGPPTSSLSASVAQASISAAAHVQSCRPLAALTGTTSSATSRYRGLSAGVQDPLASSRVPGFSIFQAEKDIDDTTSPMDFTFDAGSSINPAALTRFFATTSATSSREAPNNNNTNNNKGFEYVRGAFDRNPRRRGQVLLIPPSDDGVVISARTSLSSRLSGRSSLGYHRARVFDRVSAASTAPRSLAFLLDRLVAAVGREHRQGDHPSSGRHRPKHHAEGLRARAEASVRRR